MDITSCAIGFDIAELKNNKLKKLERAYTSLLENIYADGILKLKPESVSVIYENRKGPTGNKDWFEVRCNFFKD